MTVTISTEAAEILRLLQPVLMRDPVRNTVLGTVREQLRRVGTGGWCAHNAVALAARSSPAHPVALSDGWTDLRALADAIETLPTLAGIGGPAPAVEALVALLGRAPVSRVSERLFCLDGFDRLHEPVGVPGRARRGTDADLDLLSDWYTAFALEAHGALPAGFAARDEVAAGIRRRSPWVWEDGSGAAVSMAVRHGPVAGVARIGPVYTPREQRGHGYGSALTARVAYDVLYSAAIPVLYTDRANPTPNKIYPAIGFRPVADRASVRFG